MTLRRRALPDSSFRLASPTSDERVHDLRHRLSTLAIQVTPTLGPKRIPRKPSEVVDAIMREYGELTLATALNYVWGLGIAVLPLQDAGAFHGAFWRMHGRGVIVLKQQTKSDARWLFDLLHELWHGGEEPDQAERSLLELPETDAERRDSTEEKHASMFAGNVVLSGRAEELVKLVLKETNSDIRRFEAAVPKIAAREGVSAGSTRTTSRSDFPCRRELVGDRQQSPTRRRPLDDCPRCVLTTMRFIPSYPNRPRATNASTRRTGGTSVMSNVFPEDLAPLKVRCSDSNCEEGLHCYRATAKMVREKTAGPCLACGIKLVDWDRVHQRESV